MRAKDPYPGELRGIRDEINRRVRVLLSGLAGVNATETETISALLPGMPDIPGRPVMHPYGLASRARQGSISVTGRQGDDPGNLVVLGHRDSRRPEIDQQGEAALYNASGELIYLRLGSIHIGSKSADQPLVLGTVLQTFLRAVLDAFLNAPQIGFSPFGPVFLDPGIRTALLQYRDTYLQQDSTNILSAVSYTERGGT